MWFKLKEETNMKKQIISLTMATLMAVSTLHSLPVHAADTTTITTKAYVELLEKYAGGKKIETTGVAMGKKVSYADAAVLADRADIMRNGKKETAALKKIKSNVESKKRISDLAKIPKVKRAEVVSCFSKGIFTGKSNGTYSQSDSLSTKLYINKSQAKTIASRVKNLKNRKKITTDGQVIRTTKLPKNAKKFPYVLESIPNSYYDSYFWWEGKNKLLSKIKIQYPAKVTAGNRTMWDKPYSNKKFIESNREKWAKKVEQNLKYRLNFNYKTVSNKWVSGLRQTYFVYGDTYDQWRTKQIKAYVKEAKKNHVVIKADKIVVEPSSLYYSEGIGEYYFRCYAKFKVTADSKAFSEEVQRAGKLIYSCDPAYQYYEELKNGKWMSVAFDIGIATGTMNDLGDGYAVLDDAIYDNMRH